VIGPLIATGVGTLFMAWLAWALLWPSKRNDENGTPR